ncbi:senescence/dehydration-associated protein At4g35985, chloroplastic-like [Phoenix dactylifera]|uniref:Senescence/dehydration-associated protein At4g35985, chloroplastic-like n=1 Tax=Phoenix dactylifera TaxID=42345 RepID=A0A8B7CBZ6_PHODC|nr:senescence/dehydration-associated protein At4g35985, chloroplastic-like [Phoenix dactylifera]
MELFHSLHSSLKQCGCSQISDCKLDSDGASFLWKYCTSGQSYIFPRGTSPSKPPELKQLGTKQSMGCCKPKTSPPMRQSGCKEEVLLHIPGASVHLLENREVFELARGDFAILRIIEQDAVLATIIRIGPDLRWPLTKDEPVIKLDQVHYLFTLPDKDGGFLNYGVSFAAADSRLASLDMFLKGNTCFSTPTDASSMMKRPPSYEVYWKDYAPRVEDYNGVLAKAIAGGTGEIVKGIFKCSNAYAGQIQKGADLIQPKAVGGKTGVSDGKDRTDKSIEVKKNRGEINKSLRRVRKLSEMTEKMSRSLLDGVFLITGSVAAPLVQSKAGKSFFSMLPGEVLLASLDAVNKVLDAVEVAERKTIAATSNVVAGAVSKKFGESAGVATEDAFATAGHAVGTAWNIFKIRKALKPSSLPSTIAKNSLRK